MSCLTVALLSAADWKHTMDQMPPVKLHRPQPLPVSYDTAVCNPKQKGQPTDCPICLSYAITIRCPFGFLGQTFIRPRIRSSLRPAE